MSPEFPFRMSPNTGSGYDAPADMYKDMPEKEPNDNTEIVVTEDESCFLNLFERHLIIENKQFVIVPNGGTGDCLFKAIAQAISDDDDEAKHLDIRCQIVDYIVHKIWEKLKESIEIQHVTGNPELSDKWTNDPIKCYKDYMTQAGTLGSFIELTAAAEFFQFNFASIQEYTKDIKTYRVENFSSLLNNNERPIYHFLFTGDYESGHWEHLVPIVADNNTGGLGDGTYHGTLYILIDGVQTTLDDWLNDGEEKNRQMLVDQANGDSRSEKSESGDDEEEEEDESTRDNDTSDSVHTDEDSEEAWRRGGECPRGCPSPPANSSNNNGEAEAHTPAPSKHPLPNKSTSKQNDTNSNGSTPNNNNPIPEDPSNNNNLIRRTSKVSSRISAPLSESGEEVDTHTSRNSDWEEAAVISQKSNTNLIVSNEPDEDLVRDDIISLPTPKESSSSKKRISKLFRVRSKSASLEVDPNDKKKGCFKTLVSYVSSILR